MYIRINKLTRNNFSNILKKFFFQSNNFKLNTFILLHYSKFFLNELIFKKKIFIDKKKNINIKKIYYFLIKNNKLIRLFFGWIKKKSLKNFFLKYKKKNHYFKYISFFDQNIYNLLFRSKFLNSFTEISYFYKRKFFIKNSFNILLKTKTLQENDIFSFCISFLKKSFSISINKKNFRLVFYKYNSEKNLSVIKIKKFLFLKSNFFYLYRLYFFKKKSNSILFFYNHLSKCIYIYIYLLYYINW